MMRPLLYVFLVIVSFESLAARAEEPAQVEPELTAAQVRALAAEPDDRRNVPEPLKVYPMAREYEVSVRHQAAGQPPADAPKTVARERLVRGKYLITTVRPPGLPADVIMLVYFNGEDATYRKLVLGPGDVLLGSVGVRVAGSRTLSWVTLPPVEAGAKEIVLSQEIHTDDSTRWRETAIRDGKVIWSVEGTATATKKATDVE